MSPVNKDKNEAYELPPGWIIESNTRRTKKIDRRYTDPVTGYIFRSLKDAQRYIKTGELGRLAIKPKKNECVDKDERLLHEQMNETRRATRQSGIKIDSPPPSPPDTRTNRQAARARLVKLATLKETQVEKMVHKHEESGDMDYKETLPPPEDQPPPSLAVPLEELWTDPCIQFAVKTLTGGEYDTLLPHDLAFRNGGLK